ncbi:hypothetical protein G5V59_03295 [Nocardioides sp. W3-2-3]|uniref:hypothetical protein n=1 Tax=Nocardioides convexus TaxID=2712224 RepID=UPI002418971E|nr:hypothetical protein [Nocardioides convexus]NGZ99721.1 hypothetical protein [Nocardioides convexus]
MDVARVRLGGLLPARARISGLLVLGEERVSLAWSVDVGDDVLRRVLAVRAQAPDRHPQGWLPHVTLARRLSREEPAAGGRGARDTRREPHPGAHRAASLGP